MLLFFLLLAEKGTKTPKHLSHHSFKTNFSLPCAHFRLLSLSHTFLVSPLSHQLALTGERETASCQTVNISLSVRLFYSKKKQLQNDINYLHRMYTLCVEFARHRTSVCVCLRVMFSSGERAWLGLYSCAISATANEIQRVSNRALFARASRALPTCQPVAATCRGSHHGGCQCHSTPSQ